MKDIRICKVLTLALLLACAFTVGANAQAQEPVTKVSRQILLAEVPLSFEANQGQTDSSVKFLSRGDRYTLFLTTKEAVFTLRQGAATQEEPSVLRMEWLSANSAAQITGVERLNGTANYFIGNDPKKWHTAVPTYGKVNYRGIYRGVDAVFYGNQRELEYDFTVAPGANVQQIALAFSGAQPKLDGEGNVILSLNGDNVMLHKPIVYQGESSRKKAVEGSYVVAGNRVDFRIGPYDHSQALVIDPVISYLTYLGGSTANGPPGSNNPAFTSISCRPNACPPGFSPERGQGIAVDSSGNVYVTGSTWTVDFPTKVPFQATNKSANQWTAYVTKMNPTGTGLVYSTYLGGTYNGVTLNNDEADAIAIDASGNAYVVGLTFSGDFPTTSGSYMPKCPLQPGQPGITWCDTNGGTFLTKLSPDGQSLVYSTYVTAWANTGTIRAVAVDARGQAYISGDNSNYGNSSSTAGPVFFPTTSNALLPWTLVDQAQHQYTSNQGMAFLAVFNANGSGIVYATLYGDTAPWLHNGSKVSVDNTLNFTRGTGVAVDATGNFYLAGWTADPNIPVTPGAFQTTYSACLTCSRSFVAKFTSVDSSGGPTLVYGTYLGDMNAADANINGSDEIAGVVADANGSAYVTGYTETPGFPTTPATFNPGPCGVLNGNFCSNGAFLTKFKPDGTGLAWSTLVAYGVGGYTGIGAILSPRLDVRGNVYVAVQSSAQSGVYPQVNPVQTFTDVNAKVGITKFDPTGSKVLFSTLLGGTVGSTQYGASNQFPGGLDVDPQGSIYVGGMTSGGDLPVTAGAFEPNFPLKSNNNTGFLAKIYPFAIQGDFDVDGKSDYAVFRPANGTWFVIPSKTPTNFMVQQWGTSGDIPVPGDYDGDGKADYAVFRPSSGTWFVIPSKTPANFMVQQWERTGTSLCPETMTATARLTLRSFGLRAGHGSSSPAATRARRL